ncbi:CBS and ACT domain-containing protein [Desulfofundulus thermocisternus]|uniref:CBS and ACT domain-containing protein n=1 Tax=Desulfofundulus thermocisternus TaxID=42471 RepID=UPI0019F22501|nr:CBS and ACT domain-containing protein [Desulfofundulus thermocisternus]MBE3586408.1 CBS domain-containing protein [Thermoanaerobacter sp.]MCS5696715.1 CBS and ACT domain-containing protein [Desulfofundulus thermocisternus]
MFVRDYMSTSPICINSGTPILEALNIMRKNRIRHLPVVDKGQLVGLVTERDLLTVSPSPATTLSVFEMNYLLSKMVVKEVMKTSPITIGPDCSIEEASLIMREHKIGSLPVVEEDRLVGIITQTDILDALIRIFGLRKAGTRLVLEVSDRIGALADILAIVREHQINVIGVACREKEEQRVQIMLRLSTVEPQSLINDLQKQGYEVKSVS